MSKQAVYQRLFLDVGAVFHSQAGQDVFVASCLQGKQGGFYLEIGGGHPVDSNNSMLLETDLGWEGISLELDLNLVLLW